MESRNGKESLRPAIREAGLRVLAVGLLLGLWEVVFRAGVLDPALLPGPLATARALRDMFASGELAADLYGTTSRVVVGFTIGALLGVSVGSLTGRIRALDATLGQVVQLLRPIPPIALVPLAIVWLGLGETSKVSIIAWGVFFPVWVNTHLGVASADRLLIWAARSLGASPRRVLLRVVLPGALGYVVAGLRVGIAVAFVCVVVAEMAGASVGLGFRVNSAYLVFRVDRMIAALGVLAVLGASADAAFVPLVRALLPWYQPEVR